MTDHLKKCLERQAEFERSLKEYETQFPNYCRECQGNGEISYSYDPSPAGVFLSPGTMTDVDPCTCLEQFHCPRCNKYVSEWAEWTPGIEWDEITCPHCDWKLHISSGCPETDGECNCFDEWVEARELQRDLKREFPESFEDPDDTL